MTLPYPRALAALLLSGVATIAFASETTVMCHPGSTPIPLEQCYFYNHYIVDFPWTPVDRMWGGEDCPRVSTSTGLRAATAAASPPASLCVAQSMAPPFATLACSPVVVVPGVPPQRVIGCAAYPTSPRLQYTWITSGAVVQTTPNNPLSSTREFTCTGSGTGTIRVTITSPFGRQSMQSANVSCASPAPLPQ